MLNLITASRTESKSTLALLAERESDHVCCHVMLSMK